MARAAYRLAGSDVLRLSAGSETKAARIRAAFPMRGRSQVIRYDKRDVLQARRAKPSRRFGIERLIAVSIAVVDREHFVSFLPTAS